MNFSHQMNVHQNMSLEDCYKAAQNESQPDLGYVGDPNIKKMVIHHANAIGCPDDFIFLPLLSSCSALMGLRTKIKVNQTWTEAPIIWTIVGAEPGSRKTAALRHIMTPLLSIQREHTRNRHTSHPNVSQDNANQHSSKIIAGAMSSQDLNKVLVKNNGQIFCVTEDMEHFHKLLGITEAQTIALFHDLYSGLPYFDIQEGEINTLENTSFVHTGFATPAYLVDLHINSPPQISSRYIISCARCTKHPALWHSMNLPSDTPSLKSVLQTIHSYHQQPRTYVFSESALNELKRCHDNEWLHMMAQLESDPKRRATIEKSLGQIVRIAGVLKSLFNACSYECRQSGSHITNQFQWDLKVDRDTVCKAIELTKYFVDQKLTLMLMTDFSFGLSCYTSGNIAINVKESLRQYHQQQQRHPNSQQYVHHHHSSTANASPSVRSDDKSEENEEETQTAEFVHMDKQMFVAVHGKRIRRLLECFDDGTGVSATTTSQKSITPPVKLQSSNNRHPVWASALFFQKCQELGIGSAEQVKHPTNRKFFWRFKRKPVAELTDKLQQLLNYLRVDMTLYARIGQRCPSLSPEQIPTDLPGNFDESCIEEASRDSDLEIIIKEEPYSSTP